MIIPKVSTVLVAVLAVLLLVASEEPLLRLTEVQSTSLLVAFWRKMETQRSSLGDNPPLPSLCKDEQASVLLDALATSEQIEGYMTSPALPKCTNMMAIRTRTIDDWLMEKSAELRPRQIVNLGAGMCTRPYRLPWSSDANATIMTVFEVDDSHLLQTKHNVLGQAGYLPRVPVVHVAGDVTNDSLAGSLLQAGFDPKLPTDWIAEGLLGYLPLESHRPLFQLAHKLSAPGSRFVAVQTDPSNLDYMHSVLNLKLPHVGFKVREDTVEDFRSAGWSKNITVLDDFDFLPRYGRTIEMPVYVVLTEAGGHEAGSGEL
jgi:methyltransferase (TIGR00027 family)